jgi:hypothetical protein
MIYEILRNAKLVACGVRVVRIVLTYWRNVPRVGRAAAAVILDGRTVGEYVQER